jgi:large conductance mechanosensitive channel
MGVILAPILLSLIYQWIIFFSNYPTAMENGNTFDKLIGVSWLKESKMSILKEFREFAMRGNVVDLAVGVIIGAAFGKIVSSLVADIIMPPLGLIIGGVDFKQFAVTLRDAQGDVPAVVMHYGMFIQNIFDFIIVAFAIFMAIKLMNKLNRKKEEEPAAPVPSKEEVLLSEIRDLLKEQNNRS